MPSVLLAKTSYAGLIQPFNAAPSPLALGTQVQVELKKGKTIMIEASLRLPASLLRENFSNRSGVPLDFFELYYRGKRLAGEAALASWGVAKGSTIEVKMRGRGGGINADGKRKMEPEDRSTRDSTPSQVAAENKLHLALTEHGGTSGVRDANDALGDAFTRPENRGTPVDAVIGKSRSVFNYGKDLDELDDSRAMVEENNVAEATVAAAEVEKAEAAEHAPVAAEDAMAENLLAHTEPEGELRAAAGEMEAKAAKESKTEEGAEPQGWMRKKIRSFWHSTSGAAASGSGADAGAALALANQVNSKEIDRPKYPKQLNERLVSRGEGSGGGEGGGDEGGGGEGIGGEGGEGVGGEGGGGEGGGGEGGGDEGGEGVGGECGGGEGGGGEGGGGEGGGGKGGKGGGGEAVERPSEEASKVGADAGATSALADQGNMVDESASAIAGKIQFDSASTTERFSAEQAWSIESVDNAKKAENEKILNRVAKTLRNNPSLQCKLFGTTDPAQDNIENNQILMAHFKLSSAKNSAQMIREKLAKNRAEACKKALLERDVQEEQLIVTGDDQGETDRTVGSIDLKMTITSVEWSWALRVLREKRQSPEKRQAHRLRKAMKESAARVAHAINAASAHLNSKLATHIQFDSVADSATELAWSLTPKDGAKKSLNIKVLKFVANKLKDYPEMYCKLHGSTNASQGDAVDHNRSGAADFLKLLKSAEEAGSIQDKLAQKRALTCKNELVNQHNVPANQLIVTWAGRGDQSKVDLLLMDSSEALSEKTAWETRTFRTFNVLKIILSEYAAFIQKKKESIRDKEPGDFIAQKTQTCVLTWICTFNL